MNVEKFLIEVKKLAGKYSVNFFIVTDGASMIDNNGNEAVENCRQAHIKWELEHGLNTGKTREKG